MKKLISLMLVLMLALTMTACGGGQESTGGAGSNKSCRIRYSEEALSRLLFDASFWLMRY